MIKVATGGRAGSGAKETVRKIDISKRFSPICLSFLYF